MLKPDKKASPQTQVIRQPQNLVSQVQTNDEYITFISLSHYEMHKLVHDPQNFAAKVKSINNQAKRMIDDSQFKQALSLLNEAQKILEYAAGSGKTIERDLIICVLHNLASAYHKLWNLEKCLSYIEGLIFNIQNHLTSLQNSVVSTSNKQQIMIAMQSLQMKNMLSVYHIRFCALNSQQFNHKQALSSAKKSIQYLKNIFVFDEQHILMMMKKQRHLDKIQLKYRLLIDILDCEASLNLKRYKQILKAAHFSLQLWNKAKIQNLQRQNYPFLKGFSIGDVMDIKPIQYYSRSLKMSGQQLKIREFQESFCYKLIILSISFFSVSTELRLSNPENNNNSQIQKESNFYSKESQMYHLLSIVLIAAFLPYDILFLKHSLNSYTNHFNSSLIDYKTVEPESLQKIIELISEHKVSSKNLGSTQIISAEQIIEVGSNEYRLKDKLMKDEKRNFQKPNKKVNRVDSKRNILKNYSSLENKSIIKDDKQNVKFRNLKGQSKEKQKQRQKSKPKGKSKSKTLEKDRKSKQKEGLYFVKSSSKSKKKITYEELHTISKKVSPKKSKQHNYSKDTGSQIFSKNQKKSFITKVRSKKLITQNKSPMKRNNIYGLNY